MNLHKVISSVQRIAPLHLAASWDNVGLLVEPSPPHVVRKVMLTNDLTETVMKEAIEAKVSLIISYHPPIFRALKRLTWSDPKQRIVTMAVENRIAIYSPHTCCDAVKGGVNDWLAKSLGELKLSHPIEPTVPKQDFCFSFYNASKTLCEQLEQRYTGKVTADQQAAYTVQCTSGKVPGLISFLGGSHPEASVLSENDGKNMDGMGRICLLKEASSLNDVVERVKRHIGTPHLRVAVGENRSMFSAVKSVALCAGSGASLLNGLATDLYLTGEMSHHEVLAATAEGISVILCEHSNSERGYLHELKKDILSELYGGDGGGVEIFVSSLDADPLCVK